MEPPPTKSSSSSSTTSVQPPPSTYSYEPLLIPKDEQGYVQAFTLDQEAEFLQFFEKYGIVVIKNIISDEQADKTAEQVWSCLNNLGIKKEDPNTWKHWPWGSHLGILGNAHALEKGAWENRQNENVYKLFCKLFNYDKLLVSVDRYGMMRPTRQVYFPPTETAKAETRDMPDWKSISEWLHLDMNPWNGRTSLYAFQGNGEHTIYRDAVEYPNGNVDSTNDAFKILKVQGILGLYDCGPNEGGLHGVPGFQHELKKWAGHNIKLSAKNTYPFTMDETTVQIPKGDPIRAGIQKLPIRKGSLLVWNSMIPHGTFPNDSDKFRLIQYIKMAPVTDKSVKPALKHDSILTQLPESQLFPSDFTMTELGAKLFGLKQWEQ